MKHLKIIVSFFLVALITSCSNDDDGSGSQSNNANKVFVVGGEAKDGLIVPIIWTNGVKTFLPVVADTQVMDLKVAVENNDVYVVGVETNSNNKMSIVLWKNGVQSRFSEPANYVQIEQLIVDNGNVYVLGKEYTADLVDKYKYWKNGVATTIINTSVPVSDDRVQNNITKMTVANNDVYCIGYEWNTTGTTLTAKYWKNAVPTNIAVFKDEIFDYMSEIQVNGNDISILYNQLNTSTFAQEAKLWKNNTISIIASGSSDFFAEGMVVKDGVEHIVINEQISDSKTKVLYFKDRVKTEITDGSFDVQRSYVRVDGSNVCVAYFTDLDFNYSIKYWLNGTTKEVTGEVLDPFDALFLAGTDVYMTSSQFNVPQFWVNGKETALPFDDDLNYTVAYDVFVTQ